MFSVRKRFCSFSFARLKRLEFLRIPANEVSLVTTEIVSAHQVVINLYEARSIVGALPNLLVKLRLLSGGFAFGEIIIESS